MHETPKHPEPAASDGGPRAVGRRARTLIATVAIATLTVIGFAVPVAFNSANGPLAAVRDYANLIAAGKASQANKMVDPKSYEGEGDVDLARLTDKVLDSASTLISKIEPRYGANNPDISKVSVGETVEIEVYYNVGTRYAGVTLRVKKLANSWGPFERWAVIDPMLVPVLVETNIPEIPTAQLGTATVPTSGVKIYGFPQHVALMYPGIYEIVGDRSTYIDDSEWFSQRSRSVEVVHERHRTHTLVQIQVWFDATDALYEKVNDLIPAYVNGCIAAGAEMPDDCPTSLAPFNGGTERGAITTMPNVDHIFSAGVDYRSDGSTDAALQFTKGGTVEFTYDGEKYRRQFSVHGFVQPDGDDVKITFRKTA